jgi:hypothetical protein
VKVFFASLDQLDLEVDAWVPTREQGVTLLQALRMHYQHHSVVMRARMQRYQNYEERFIGLAGDAGDFIERVKVMGYNE